MPQNAYISPCLLECLHFSYQMSPGEKPVCRIVKDYEIDINLIGERVIWVDGKRYDITPGSVVCRVPGQLVESVGNFDMYTLTLDFTHSTQTTQEKYDRNMPSASFQPLNDSYYWKTIPACFVPLHSAEILTLYKKIYHLSSTMGSKESIDCLLATLLHLLLSDAFAEQQQIQWEKSPVDIIVSYINEHYTEKLTLDRLASVVMLNKSYLVRYFHKETGTTPIEYLNRVRLATAKKLLLNSGAPIKVIADQCGFESVNYFTSCFRRQFSETPGEYRENYLSGQNRVLQEKNT